MICPNCGANLPDGSVFCGSCGTALGTATGNQPMYSTGQQPTSSAADQQPTGQPVYGQTPPNPGEQGGAGLGIASMVLGIVSLVFACCVPYITFFTALIGLILGGVAIKNDNKGKGMAIAGLVCSIIALVPAACIVIASCLGCGSGITAGLLDMLN